MLQLPESAEEKLQTASLSKKKEEVKALLKLTQTSSRITTHLPKQSDYVTHKVFYILFHSNSLKCMFPVLYDTQTTVTAKQSLPDLCII